MIKYPVRLETKYNSDLRSYLSNHLVRYDFFSPYQALTRTHLLKLLISSELDLIITDLDNFIVMLFPPTDSSIWCRKVLSLENSYDVFQVVGWDSKWQEQDWLLYFRLKDQLGHSQQAIYQLIRRSQ